MTTTSEIKAEAFLTKKAASYLDASHDAVGASSYYNRKYRFERILGTALLVPASPVILSCWLLVKLTSRGPGFYRQTRVGQHGRNFKVIKLRTMRLDAEAAGPQWSTKADPRITRLGVMLRTLHLDELPQLWNVVRGDMVLVGPRPERPEFVDLLVDQIPGYERRLLVKPGITGLSQINLPPDSTLRCVERKQVLDLHHIEQANLWMDKRMILLTALRLIGIRNERLVRWMRLDRLHLLEELPCAEKTTCSVALTELLEEAKAREAWQGKAKASDADDSALDTPREEEPRMSRPR